MKNQLESYENSENVAGFRSVFKATSIFGGVQVFNIIISLIRGKVLALLIGTAGMGLNGLLLSSLNLIEKVSSLGLGESAVRDISGANNTKDHYKISYVYTVFKRWIWLSAIIGVVLTVALSPLLSKISFNDRNHTVSFLLLSVTFIFGALTGGIYTLLRGLRKIKDLARANISGSIAGLLVAIPIFYFYGIKGVIPAIIATSIVTYLISIYFRKKVNIRPVKLSVKDTFLGGKEMVSLGIVLTASSLLTAGVKFIVNAYITKTGSLEALGVYNAGQSIMAGYVGMVFTAMGIDYFPRLSGVIKKPDEWKVVVIQQAEIILLILGPILTFVLLSTPILIRVLLTSEFFPAIDFIVWASLSVIFRGISWVSSFIIIAKGDNKLFLYTQLAAQIWSLLLNILFYNILGVKGLGISMTINNFLGAVLIFFVLKSKYRFILSKETYSLTGVSLLLISTTILFITLYDYPKAYYFAGTTFIISAIISFKGLNSRMNITKALREYWNNSVK